MVFTIVNNCLHAYGIYTVPGFYMLEHCCLFYVIVFKTQEFITQRSWAVVSEQSKGTTLGLRVIIFLVPCVFMSNF